MMATGATAQPVVLIMAGGTGGHVFPGLAAAACLRSAGVRVEWLGTQRGIESRLVPQAGLPLHYIAAAGLRGKGLLSLLRALLAAVYALWQSWQVLRRVRPDCVLGMGGFVAGPGGLMARLSGRKLVIHEQNAVMGTTNGLLARIAHRVLLGFPLARALPGRAGAAVIGNPVREAIAAIAAPEQRYGARRGALRLLVLGGSLGAKPINELLPQALCALDLAQRPEVWHQCGEAHLQAVRDDYSQAQLEARVEPFIADMAEAYAWADLVICRAGALTVAEISAAGVAALLVPLPHAIDDHQCANARWLADRDAAILLEQATLSADGLARELQQLNAQRERLLAMAQKARALAHTDAAQKLAQICVEMAHGR